MIRFPKTRSQIAAEQDFFERHPPREQIGYGFAVVALAVVVVLALVAAGQF